MDDHNKNKSRFFSKKLTAIFAFVACLMLVVLGFSQIASFVNRSASISGTDRQSAAVIKGATVTQLPAVPGEPINWTVKVDASTINAGQHLLTLPKSAGQIKITPAVKAEVKKVPATTKTASAKVSLSDKQKLSELAKQNAQSAASVALAQSLQKQSFLSSLWGVFSKIGNSITAAVEDAVAPADDTATPDVTVVDLAPQASDDTSASSTTPADLTSTSETPVTTTPSETDTASTSATSTPVSDVTPTATTTTVTQDVVVEYKTPAPVIAEATTDTGKIVTVSDGTPADVAGADTASTTDGLPHTTDVLAFTNIPEIYKVGQESKIHIKWKNNGDQAMEFHAYDLNGNGKLDYVEWTVPHLSEQTFEIIFISKAFELDAEQNIISDVYDSLKTQDNNWASFTDGQYARVTFYKQLTDKNDNTIYARPTDPSSPSKIEVYPVYTDQDGNQTEGPLAATFNNIDHEGLYKIFLTGLQTPTDVFDLKVIGGVDLDYVVDPSGMLVKYGSFVKPISGTLPVAQQITGVGFQPKVVMFFGNDATADGPTTNAREFFGAASSPTARAVIGGASPNGGTNPNKRKWLSRALAIVNITEGATATVNSSADFVSMDADGFSISWTAYDATARVVNYVAIGGTDVANASVGSFTTPTAASSSYAVTGTGFKPDALIFFDNALTTSNAADGDAASSVFNMGFAISPSKQSNRVSNRTTAAATTYSYQRTDSVMNSVSGAGAVARTASFVSMDNNGFSLNFSLAPPNAVYINYIALKGGQYDTGAFNQNTTTQGTGNQAIAGVGFQPTAVLLQSFGFAAGTATVAGSRMSFGVGVSSAQRGSIWSGDAAQASSLTNQDLDRTKVLKTMIEGASPTVTSAMDFVSNDSNGFTVNNTTVDATSRQILYFAMGANPVAGGNPTMVSAANQTFAVNDQASTTPNIVITDTTPATITATNGIRIQIPAGLHAVWDQTATVTASGATVPGKVAASPTVTYDDTTTAYIHVSGDFAAGDAVTISGLKLKTFSSASAASSLGLITGGAAGSVVVSDTATKAIGAPIMVSAADQTFYTNSTTTMQTITVTDDATNAVINTVNGLRINIPAAFNLTWDPTVTTMTKGGTASGSVSATVSYADSNHTLVIPVTSNFTAGQTLTIAGLNYVATAGTSSASHLNLVTSGSISYITSADSKSITVSAPSVPGAPTIGTATAGNANASVTFSAPGSNGGATIDSYTVTSNSAQDGTPHTATGASSPITVSSLINGDTYTFTVTAHNSVGNSSASAASNSVTPSAPSGGCTATGGTITTYTDGNGTHEVHTFSSTGTFTVTGTCNAQVLTVGGGGSGGLSHTSGSGGGGAGGVVYDSSHALTAQAYTVTVGTGGASRLAASGSGNGNPGNDSVFDALTAKGGGYGSYSPNVGGTGGSGGGGGGVGGAGATNQTSQGAATVYGNVGCAGATGSGGGGGGAGGACTAGAATPAGGNGGNGISNSVTGSAVVYGGGGGGAPSGTGGTGGGGAGAPAGAGTAGSPGTNGLGSGGGAAYGTASADTGAGGSGVVIVSFVTGVATSSISMVSAANQTFAVGNASTTISDVTVTDASPTATITHANGIGIQIPAGLNAFWDWTVTTATASGAAVTATKMVASAAVTYSADHKTAYVAVASDFTAGLAVTISGLKLGSFNTSFASYLGLVTGGAQVVVVSDSKSKTVTAPTVPGAPTIGTATAGNANASVTFTAPGSDGGSTITSYTVTSTSTQDGTPHTASGASSPITVSGLTNGDAYTFSVTATNAVGTSTASVASNSVTPATGPIFTQVQSVVGSTATAATSVTCTLSAVTAGHLIVTAVASDKSAGTYTVPSGFTLIQSGVSNPAEGTSGAMAYKISAGGETTVTWTQTTSSVAGMACWAGEYSGTASSGVLDVSAENEADMSGTTAYTSISTGTTGTTAQANELAVSLMACDTMTNCYGTVGNGRGWSNGFVETGYKDVGGSGGVGMDVATTSLTSVGTVTTTYSTGSGTTGDQMYATVATFKAAVNSATMASAADQSFTVGDATTTLQDITVTDITPATIKSATGIRIKIPAGLNAVWDQTVTSASASGTAVSGGKVSATPVVSYDNATTAYVHVGGDFADGNVITISGLKLGSFSSASSASYLGLIVDGSTVVTSDTKSKTIVGPSTYILSYGHPATTFLPDTAGQYFGTFNIYGTGTLQSLAVTDYGSGSATAATDLGVAKLIQDNGNGTYNSSEDTTVLATTTFVGARAAFTGLNIVAASGEYVHVVVDVTSKILPTSPTAGLEVVSGDATSTGTVMPAVSWPVTLGLSTMTTVYPYLQLPTKTSIEVSWNSSNSATGGSVGYGLTNGSAGSYTSTVTETVTPVSVSSSPVVYTHKVALSGLSVGTPYHYQVTDQSGVKSADATFTTAPADGTPFNFLVLGDVANNGDGTAFFTASANVSEAVTVNNPKTIGLMTGDLASDGSDNEWQPQVFLPERNILKNTAVFRAKGNHDYGGNSPTTFPEYFDAFSSNNTGGNSTSGYYSFNYGNVHFVVIDANLTMSNPSTEYSWLAADMATPAAQNADWRVAAWHEPGISYGGNHGSGSDPINAIASLDSAAGVTKNFDLILMGHNHIYQRDYAPEGKNGGINWITDGTIGGDPSTGSTGTYLQYNGPGGYFGYLVFSSTHQKLSGTYYHTDTAGISTTPVVDETFNLNATISSVGNKTFNLHDPSTLISTTTITDATAASITAANDIRVRISASSSMEWDQTISTATFGGTASAKVSTTVSYPDAKTLLIDVTSGFANNDTLTLSGLKFTNFNATSSAASLGLIVGGSTGTIMTTDDKTETINGTTPTQTINSVGGDSSAPYVASSSAPVVNLTLSGNGDCRASQTAKSYDNMSGDIDCTGDGTTSISCPLSTMADSLAATFYIACEDSTQIYKDTAGTATSVTVQIDTTAPNTADDYSAKSGQWQNGSQTITLTPADPAPSSTISWTKYCTSASLGGCSIDATHGTAYDAGNKPVVSTEGTTYFYYASKDVAGNIQTPVLRTVMVDTTKPVTTSSATSNGSGYNFGSWTNANVTVTLGCADGGSSCHTGYPYYCTYTDASPTCNYASYSTPVVVSTAGTSYIKYYSVDNMNNTETAVVKTVNIDKSGPSVNAGVDEFKKAQFTQDATVTAGTSGIASYLWTKFSGPGSITFGSATTEDTTVSASVEGTYDIRLTVTDTASNSVYDDFILVWDTTVPTVSAGSNQTKNVQFTQTGTASDSGSGIASYLWTKVSGPGTITFGTTTQPSTTISAGTDGSYVIKLTATDNATNSASSTFALIWDTTAPNTTDNYSTNDGQWQNGSQTITLTPADPAPSSTISWTKYCTSATLGGCTLDDTHGTAYDAGNKPVISTEGTTYFYYASKDVAGNIQTPVLRTVMVDTTKPSTIADAGSYAFSPAWASSTVTVSLACVPGSGSGCSMTYYCTDSSSSSPCTPNLVYNSNSKPAISTPGISYIRYNSVDVAGNAETPVTKTIQIDQTAPTATDNFTDNVAWQKTDQSITMSSTDSGGSGVAGIYYCTQQAPLTAGPCDPTTSGTLLTSPYKVTVSLDGTTYLRYAAEDNAGNKQATVSKTMMIDKTPPSVYWIGFDVDHGSYLTSSAPFYLAAEVADNLSGIDASSYHWTKVSGPGNVTFSPDNTSTTTISASTDGVYDIRLSVADNLGNVYTSDNANSPDFIFTWGTVKNSSSTGGGSAAGGTWTSAAANLQIPTQPVQSTQPAPSSQTTSQPATLNPVAQATSLALQGLKTMSTNSLNNLALTPVSTDVSFFADKFPQLQNTLNVLGVNDDKLSDVKKLSSTDLYLPGLTQTISSEQGTGDSKNPEQSEIVGSDSKITSPDNLQLSPLPAVTALPLAQMSVQEIKRIPSDIVFARAAGGSVDLSSALTVNTQGKVEQKIATVSGKPLELVIKPDNPASRVTGLITLKNSQNANKTQANKNTSAKLLGAALSATSPVQTTQSSVPGNLLLQKFEYAEVRPGVFRAEFNAPTAGGEYEITTIVEYKDQSLTPSKTNLTALVDPEGYVYQQTANGKLRIAGATVSIYWLNPSTNKYELWPAEKFLQKNPTLTDDTGKYSFLVPQGTYYLTANAAKYLDFKSKPISVKENNDITVNIEMNSNSPLPSWINFGTSMMALLSALVVLVCILIVLVITERTRRNRKL